MKKFIHLFLILFSVATSVFPQAGKKKWKDLTPISTTTGDSTIIRRGTDFYRGPVGAGGGGGSSFPSGSGIVKVTSGTPGLATSGTDFLLPSAISNMEVTTNKGAPSGYAPLNSSSRVPIVNIASGTPDGTKFVRDDGALAVPPSSYLEYTNYAGFPGSGTVGIMYADKATNLLYRWSGSAYVLLSPSTVSANFEEVYGSKSIREYPAIYSDAVSWNSTVLGSEISQIMYSLNGGSYTTPSYPVSIPAGARVNYKIVFVNDTYDLSAFILRFTKI